MILGKQLLLASGSPRRRELLAALDTDFKIVSLKDINEDYPSTLKPTEVAEYIALKKCHAYDNSQLGKNDILITADTIVILGDKVLGKPADTADAVNMLKMLSGNTHTVITGMALKSKDKIVTLSTTTHVTFDTLTDEQIDYYIAKYQPLDKAGAYGIQEWIGYIGIAKISGCYYNVMGLPLHDLYKALTTHFIN